MSTIVTRIVGIEWYDGWLASIVELDTAQTLLAATVAIECGEQQSLFAMCPVSREEATQMIGELECNGFGGNCNHIWLEALSRSPIYLVDQEPVVGLNLVAIEASAAQRARLGKYSLPLIDVATSPDAIQFWLK